MHAAITEEKSIFNVSEFLKLICKMKDPIEDLNHLIDTLFLLYWDINIGS